MATTRVSVTAPKGTVKTEVIMGTAASKLAAGMKSLTEVVSELGTMTEKMEENALIIANQEATIAAKDQELKNKIAQDKIDLQQAYDTNKKAFVVEWLEENGYTMILKNDLQGLKDQLAEAVKSNEAEVKKEVAIVTNTLTRNHENALKTKELEFKAAQAENIAKINLLSEKNTFLAEQAKKWEDAADKARQATVEVAKSGGIQQTITGNNK